MILTKKQISEIVKAYNMAEDFENKAQLAAQKLSNLISKYSGVNGIVDHLQGDGFGFTPECNDDTHIPIYDLIEFMYIGEDITEELILSNLSL